MCARNRGEPDAHDVRSHRPGTSHRMRHGGEPSAPSPRLRERSEHPGHSGSRSRTGAAADLCERSESGSAGSGADSERSEPLEQFGELHGGGDVELVVGAAASARDRGASAGTTRRGGTVRSGADRSAPRRRARRGSAPTAGPCRRSTGSGARHTWPPRGPAPRPSRATGDRRARPRVSGASSSSSSARCLTVNPAATPTWCSRPSSSYRPSSSEPTPLPSLWTR